MKTARMPKQYSVGYKDANGYTHELCCYAFTAYEARLQAIEDVGYINQHPNAIKYILEEPFNG